MGVPKFFRYISERYPCLSEVAREHCIPSFDNLYLDMNGIIHNCSHPDDGNIHFSITEEEMFKDIFTYIDKLFFLIKPQRLFFMAVDGVAPRAKMNQQRSRRFRAAKDAETLSLQAKNRGEEIKNVPFDSNCITPGTEFMERLHNALRFFIKSKISTDHLWQRCRVILSGHDSPGEGEHKIMDYIRYLKSQKDFDPHTRHCLYGLDADLIILGLCTHELHFVVLREEVKFGKKTKRASIEETRFFLLHLGLFREYLELEFSALQQYKSFSMSKLIDDWVLMGFLVGNDFIPHLPCMHISSNALPLVYQTYMKIYPKLGGNINENGTLNLTRLEIFMEALSEVEFEIFGENYADLKYFEAKQSKNGIDEAFDFDVSEITEENHDDDLAELIESSRKFCEGEAENEINSGEGEQHIDEEFRLYKRNYYIKKLNFEEMTTEVVADLTKSYVEALQWTLHYYYKGVQSWGWYYPHHYAPFISDLKNLKDLKIEFNMGKPFLPFEQLLAVLPAASRSLLPNAYQDLFISPNSEIIHFYPKDFETDLNGKRNEWEAVVLIPFIDEKLFLHAMKKCETDLKPDEVKRNSHGPMLQYDYTSQSQGEQHNLFAVRAVYHVFCTEKPLWRDQISIPSKSSPLVELEIPDRHAFVPGFPTLKHLKFKYELRNARIRVFDYPARNDSMILIPESSENNNDIAYVTPKCLDRIVYIGWPHLIKAKVVGISNANVYVTADGVKENNTKLFEMEMKIVREHLSSRMGIEIGQCKVLVHVKTLIGTTVACGSQGKVGTYDVWSQSIITYPAGIVVSDINVQDSYMQPYKKVENLYPADSRIFFVGNPYFGSEGTVLNPMFVYECGRLQVCITVLPDPDLTEAKTLQGYLESDYLNTYQIQSILGLNSKCLLRLTSQMMLIMGEKRPVLSENVKKVNIGLHMRFPKQNEELCGYTRRKDNSWFFSPMAIETVKAYIDKFPMVTDYLLRTSSSSNYEFCYESDLFPGNVGGNCVEEIINWIAEQDFTKAERVPCGTKTVEKEAVERIIESIDKLKTLPVKTVKLQVKPHLLMKPNVNLPEQYKPKHPIRLFDRVVVVRNTYLVPIGSRGTVIGISPVSDPNPVRLECVKQTSYFLDVLFDKSIQFGNSIYGIAEGRVMRVPETAVLTIFANDNSSQNETAQKTLQVTTENPTFVSPRKSNTSSTTSAQVKYQQNTPPKTQIVAAPDNNLKYFDDNEEKVNSLSKENFWMPSPETKQKHYNTLSSIGGMLTSQTTSYSNLMENRVSFEIPPHIPHMLPGPSSEINSGTEVLKSMLGLQSNSNAASNIHQNKPMVNASQFPPPPTWRNSNSFGGNNNPLPSNPSVDQRKKNVPLHYYGQSLPHFAPQQQLPYVNDNFYSPISLNQKGAFIPLQALKNSPQKPPQALPQVLQGPVDVGKIEERIRNCSIDTSSASTSRRAVQATATASSSSEISLEAQQKKATTPKKPPKASKIAAKFDNL